MKRHEKGKCHITDVVVEHVPLLNAAARLRRAYDLILQVAVRAEEQPGEDTTLPHEGRPTDQSGGEQ